MKETKYTKFSTYVRSLLLINEKSQVWLAEQFGMTNNSIQNKLKNDSFSIAEQHYIKSILADPSRVKPLTLSKAEFACLADVQDVDQFIKMHDVCLTREGKVLVVLSREARHVLGTVRIGEYLKGVRITGLNLIYSPGYSRFLVSVDGIKNGGIACFNI